MREDGGGWGQEASLLPSYKLCGECCVGQNRFWPTEELA